MRCIMLFDQFSTVGVAIRCCDLQSGHPNFIHSKEIGTQCEENLEDVGMASRGSCMCRRVTLAGREEENNERGQWLEELWIRIRLHTCLSGTSSTDNPLSVSKTADTHVALYVCVCIECIECIEG